MPLLVEVDLARPNTKTTQNKHLTFGLSSSAARPCGGGGAEGEVLKSDAARALGSSTDLATNLSTPLQWHSTEIVEMKARPLIPAARSAGVKF